MDFQPSHHETSCTPLAQAVRQAFSADGALSRAEADFRPRPGQTEMAMAVAQTIEHGRLSLLHNRRNVQSDSPQRLYRHP